MVFRGKIQILGLVAVAAMLCTTDVMAQRGGNPYSRSTNLMQLIRNESVQEHLEMSPDQVAEIDIINEESGERRNEAMQDIREEFRNGDRDSAMKMAREVMSDLTKEDEDSVEELLVGDQMKMLRQIALQQDLKGRNRENAMSRLLDMVDATEEEREKYAEVKARVEKETQAKYQKIIRRAMTQVFQESLSAAKAKKADEIIGDMIDVQIEQQGFRGGGDRGRGGDRGQRGGGDRGQRGGGDRGQRGGGDRGGRGGDGGNDF